jgi:hypothetical protein
MGLIVLLIGTVFMAFGLGFGFEWLARRERAGLPPLPSTQEGGGPSHPAPALQVFDEEFETLLLVRSPAQFQVDRQTCDWLLTEEWEDGICHTIRVHFTTVGAQGSVTTDVLEALGRRLNLGRAA